jgi:hypothetical protein
MSYGIRDDPLMETIQDRRLETWFFNHFPPVTP